MSNWERSPGSCYVRRDPIPVDWVAVVLVYVSPDLALSVRGNGFFEIVGLSRPDSCASWRDQFFRPLSEEEEELG